MQKWGTIDCVFILFKIFSPSRPHNLADKISIDHEQDSASINILKFIASGLGVHILMIIF